MPMLCTVLGLEACSHVLEVESVKAFSLSSLYDSSFSLIFHILFNLILRYCNSRLVCDKRDSAVVSLARSRLTFAFAQRRELTEGLS